jgi:hypothetical protein
MRRLFVVTIAALAVAACSAGAQSGSDGGGQRTQRNFDVGQFQSVSLGGSPNVIVTVGGAHSVRAEGDADALERLDIRVENGELRIGTRRGNLGFGSRNRQSVTIHVTAPSLAAASIGGSGDMRIDRVEGESFSASIAGSGDMNVAALRVADANFSVAGSGAISAAGTTQRSRVSVAGSGDVNLEALETRAASVSVVGSGNVITRAMETAEVSVMGSGDVQVTGSARCTVNKMGSGDVRCGA